MFDTGLRNLELCDLKVEGVKVNYFLIWGKGNKERIVPKSIYLSKILFKYERLRVAYFEFRQAEEEYFFLSRTGRKLTVEAIARIVRQAGNPAGVNPDLRCSHILADIILHRNNC